MSEDLKEVMSLSDFHIQCVGGAMDVALRRMDMLIVSSLGFSGQSHWRDYMA